MKNNKIIIIFSLIASFAFLSCAKYEEGPGISLLPKKTRIQHKWKLAESVTAGGIVQTVADNGDYIEFIKGGTITIMDGATGTGYSGTWAFSADKKHLITAYEIIGLTFHDTTEIINLKINDLGLRASDGSKSYYIYK